MGRRYASTHTYWARGLCAPRTCAALSTAPVAPIWETLAGARRDLRGAIREPSPTSRPGTPDELKTDDEEEPLPAGAAVAPGCGVALALAVTVKAPMSGSWVSPTREKAQADTSVVPEMLTPVSKSTALAHGRPALWTPAEDLQRVPFDREVR